MMRLPARLLRSKAGLLLDISPGGTPQENAIVLSTYANVLMLPFPLPTASVHTAVLTHVLEYLAPELFFPWWDDLWRIMKPKGIVYVSGPYGGDDHHGWITDPAHRVRIVEQSFAWLDPRTPLYELHAAAGRRPPKPWHTLTTARVPASQDTISYNAMLQVQPLPTKG